MRGRHGLNSFILTNDRLIFTKLSFSLPKVKLTVFPLGISMLAEVPWLSGRDKMSRDFYTDLGNTLPYDTLDDFVNLKELTL
jgi:hypothetical protein